jgi:hypothetical protein
MRTTTVYHGTRLIKRVAGGSILHFTLSRGESIGLAFETEAGLSSAIAASIVLGLVFVSLEHFWTNFFFFLMLFSAPDLHRPIGNHG